MRFPLLGATRACVLCLGMSVAGSLQAQEPEIPPVDADVVLAYARAYMDLTVATLDLQFELASSENKTEERHASLHEAFIERRLEILSEHGFTDESYRLYTYLVSADDGHRQAFEAALAALEEEARPQ